LRLPDELLWHLPLPALHRRSTGARFGAAERGSAQGTRLSPPAVHPRPRHSHRPHPQAHLIRLVVRAVAGTRLLLACRAWPRQMPPSRRCAAPRTPRTLPGANLTPHAPLHMQVGNARCRPSTWRPRCRQPTAGAAAGVSWHGLCRWTRGRAAARRRTRRSRQWLDSACSTRSFGGCWQPDRPAAQGSGAAFWRRIGGLRW